MKKIRILYIQHASGLGGSAKSLLYTIKGLNRDIFEPTVALIEDNADLIRMYKDEKIKIIIWRNIVRWEHSTVAQKKLYNITTWIHLLKVMIYWNLSKKSTIKLIDEVKPDIVHLNSMPLSSCASALKQINFPFVWHIREPAQDQGLRTYILRKLMLNSDELIFISKADRQSWVRDIKGHVIPNFVEEREINENVREELNIPISSPVILYLGTLRKLKGIFVLLRALTIIKSHIPDIRCIMLGSEYPPPPNTFHKIVRKILPLAGYGTTGQRALKFIEKYGLTDVCIRLPFKKDITPYIAASDVLVFPATRPHFARPVIEAATFGKPSVATNLPGMNELIEDGNSGLLFENKNPDDLADKIISVLKYTDRCKAMGNQAKKLVKEKFSMEKNVAEIVQIYNRVLNNHSHARA